MAGVERSEPPVGKGLGSSAYYNFCRVHSTIKTTPAVAAGLTDHVWTVKELLEAIATPYPYVDE